MAVENIQWILTVGHMLSIVQAWPPEDTTCEVERLTSISRWGNWGSCLLPDGGCGLTRAAGRGPPSLHPAQWVLEPRFDHPARAGMFQGSVAQPGETPAQPDHNLQMTPRTRGLKSPSARKAGNMTALFRIFRTWYDTSGPKSLTTSNYHSEVSWGKS